MLAGRVCAFAFSTLVAICHTWAQPRTTVPSPQSIPVAGSWARSGWKVPAKSGPTTSIQELQHSVPAKAARESAKGEKARDRRDYQQAVEHFERAIQLDPEFVAARNNLAGLYLVNNQPALAIEQLEAAVAVDPHRCEPYSNLALGYLMVGRMEAAERAARRTLDLDRGGSQSRMLLGLVLVVRGKLTPEALDLLERVEPEFVQAHLLAAHILASRGDYKQASAKVRAFLASGETEGRDLAQHWLRTIEEAQKQDEAKLNAITASAK